MSPLLVQDLRSSFICNIHSTSKCVKMCLCGVWLHVCMLLPIATCRYRLTSVAVEDLLKLISSMIPSQSSKFLKSLHRFKKLFQNFFPHISSDCQYYCTVCHALCSNGQYCHGEQNVKAFYTANVEEQLKAKFKGN